MEKDGGMDKSRGYNLGYTGNNEFLGEFQDFIRERLGTEYNKMVAVGSVIGVHVWDREQVQSQYFELTDENRDIGESKPICPLIL